MRPTVPVSLPIDALLPDVRRALEAGNSLVVEAAPGAGKTTRVPPALLDAPWAKGREVLVLEPRRLPVRLSARRVAEERGQSVGGEVGYRVRFEDVSGPGTRLLFLTEALLLRRMLSDPELKNVAAVVFDEFHERHAASDVALAVLRQLQRTRRPDLKLVAMSATLDAAAVAGFLGAPAIKSEGRVFPVDVRYLESVDARPIPDQVVGALKRLLVDSLDGHVLAFLPGAGEIRRCLDGAAELASRHGLLLFGLHGEMASDEQDRALAPSQKRKVIFATNVAETSVTIDGVAAVIDSGVARVASVSAWSGLSSLELAKVSRSSCEQRAGRAGRTRAGLCQRLYTRGDFEQRPKHDEPELLKIDLAETILLLHALGHDPRSLQFLDAPRPAAVSAATTLLQRLGALDAGESLTPAGRRMLEFPVHPRLARVLLEGEQVGIGARAAKVAAILSERELRLEARANFARNAAPRRGAGDSDIIALLERFQDAEASGPRSAGLDGQAFSSAGKVAAQLTRVLKRSTQPPVADEDTALEKALLAGFPDRVGKRREKNGSAVLIAGGTSARLPEGAALLGEFFVALDANERASGTEVRLTSHVEPDWLMDAFPALITDSRQVVWNSEARRVEEIERLSFLDLALDETRRTAPPSADAEAVLAQAMNSTGLEALVGAETVERFFGKLEALRLARPELELPPLDAALNARITAALAQGHVSFTSATEAPFMEIAATVLPESAARALRAALPDRLSLPSGRSVEVHYRRGTSPWVESRLQDFFGMKKGPAICEGRLPLVIHLLAPNHRAVQVTTDLEGFWSRHYPAVRKELMRKYPRHLWPDDPLTAKPPQKGIR